MDATSRAERSFPLPYTHQALRDLAFLLLSPPPWRTGRDLSSANLLGPDGLGLLAALEDDPTPLSHWLGPTQTGERLGRYAERLLAFWFRLAPHIETVAANLPVRNAALRTIGEFDFLIRLDGRPLHVETASKFYLQLGHGPDTLIGPSLRDAWRLKAAKLQEQLRLARHAVAQTVLPADFRQCDSAARVAGWFFYAPGAGPQPPLAEEQLTGWYAPLTAPWPRQAQGSRWVWLSRLGWLSPARVTEAATREEDSLRRELLQSAVPQLVAELLPVGDGHWEEISRGFVIPPGWPQEERLTALLDEVGRLGTAS